MTTVVAADPNAGQTLSYSINGGADASKFAINVTTGALAFVTAPNFEAPTDAGGNNVYDVTVQVSDGNGGSDAQAIAVTVTNQNNLPSGDTGSRMLVRTRRLSKSSMAAPLMMLYSRARASR